MRLNKKKYICSNYLEYRMIQIQTQNSRDTNTEAGIG